MVFSAHVRKALVPGTMVRCVLFAGVPAVVFYGLAVAVMSKAGYGVMEILRDPAQQSGQSSFLGFVSNIGIWVWISSVAICFFGAATSAAASNRRQRELLVLVGMLSLLLAIDDFFMIHDRYVDQRLCYVTYAVLACLLLVRHYRGILRVDGFAFLSAGLLLALSILTDLGQSFIPLSYSHAQVIEEGFKFIGAATWLYFSWRIASFALQNSPVQQQELGQATSPTQFDIPEPIAFGTGVVRHVRRVGRYSD